MFNSIAALAASFAASYVLAPRGAVRHTAWVSNGARSGSVIPTTALWSSVFPPDGGGSDEERRQRKAGVPGGERDPVFDVPLANDAFVRSMPRSDNGTRNSEFDGLVPDDPPPPQINSFTQIVSRLSSTEAIGR